MTVADRVAAYLAERGITHIFGIIGAGNVRLFDAIARLGKTEIISVHHEQAAVMAAMAWGRVRGEVGVALVTTGAGSSNALTGVLSAYMDSIPVVVIAGNEASTRPDVGRARGVQGFDAAKVTEPMTKFAATLVKPALIRSVIDRFFAYADDGRPGPVWLELAMDVQGMAA